MTFSDFENILSLICTIAGLLYGFFKYVEKPTKGFRYLICFFLANFLGEYYWTVYVMVMRTDPNVSDAVSYLGWNIAIVFLLMSVRTMQNEASKRFFHPLILLPVFINIPQFYLYITFEGELSVDLGGLLNNIWQVGITTLAACLCLQEIVYFIKHDKERRRFPWFSLLVILYLITKYAMWTSSCFSWPSEILSPYAYCSILNSEISLFLAYGAEKFYAPSKNENDSQTFSDPRTRALIQIMLSLAIIGICAIGYFITVMLRNTGFNDSRVLRNEDYIVIYLLILSAVVIFLVLILLFLLTSRYRRLLEKSRGKNEDLMGRVNFITTITVTFILMAIAVVFNVVSLYNSSINSVYEDGDNVIRNTVTDIENYLTLTKTTLRVTADSIDLMLGKGSSDEEILNYITAQTQIQSEQFDKNFTGIYAYIDGKYMDGTGWEPPQGYDPVERDWYKTAVEANGEVVIVTPYVDAQTGSVVITIARQLSETDNRQEKNTKNIVCLDVLFNHIKNVAKGIDIRGRGYCMIVNNDGLIIAHKDSQYDGKNITDCYGQDFYDNMINSGNGRFEMKMNYSNSTDYNSEKCTVFVSPVMDQWYTLIVIPNREWFEDIYSQLAISITVSLITFCLISFFYYIGYKNEQLYGKKVEEMNLQVVSALASAIDAKDTYTNGHSSRVAKYSKMIAERAGYSKSEQDEIYMMGLLHDVGKIGVPDEVINKAGKLTEEEFELIKKHPEIGSGILEMIKERPKLSTGARWHHERYAGGGYPDGLSGDAIPKEVRIITVADAYDAMTSRRSYRDVISQDKVRSELEKCAGTQFDPEFARIMIDLINEDTGYTMREI